FTVAVLYLKEKDFAIQSSYLSIQVQTRSMLVPFFHVPLFLVLSTLPSTISAAGFFALVEQGHADGGGCDIKLNGICGCFAQTKLQQHGPCDSLGKPTHRTIEDCGNGRVMFGGHKKGVNHHYALFDGPGCRSGCYMPKGKLKGAPDTGDYDAPGVSRCDGN
ncbi:MAG: hypothetical protein LQ341_007371, partial [Variospora aurantia]